MTDTYTKEAAKREVDRIIREGKAPIVTLSIFDHIDELKPSDNLKGKIEYTIDIYNDLISEIKKLPMELRLKYLITLKNAEVINNQVMEDEDPFLIALSQEIDSTSALDIAINRQEEKFTKEDFIYLHDFLLSGTSSSNQTGLREDNLKFVGTWQNGERNIQYFPIDYRNIDEALKLLLDYYNSNINNISDEYEAIITPMIYHGLIATLQLFKDGNTRFARTIQHVELWGMLNNISGKETELPIAYVSNQYIPYRNQYRELIQNIAVNNNVEAWNEWFKFNLSRIQDSIYKNEDNIQKLKRRMK